MAAIGSRPIRAHHSSHVHARVLSRIELCCIRARNVYKKNLVQETMSDGQVSVQVSCTSFLTVCHHHKSHYNVRIGGVWLKVCSRRTCT